VHKQILEIPFSEEIFRLERIQQSRTFETPEAAREHGPRQSAAASQPERRADLRGVRSRQARHGIPPLDVPAIDPAPRWARRFVRGSVEGFPEVSEIEVIRHFTRLSTWNYAIDLGMYPLGSCTMKYNPRVNEFVARLEGLATEHPSQPAEAAAGLPAHHV
jgi:glycine dehydrogenase subunit 2